MFERGSLGQARKWTFLYGNFLFLLYNLNCSGWVLLFTSSKCAYIFKQGLLCCDGKTKSCDTIPVIFGIGKENYS